MEDIGDQTPADTRRGPFDRLRPTVAVAAVHAAAAVVWIVAGARLPGGRWLAVHLFTLGVLTNLILSLSDHFSRALTRRPGAVPRWQLVATNAAALLVFWGMTSGLPVPVVLGATALSAVVFTSYLRLRHLRRAAIGPRFAWVVRMYERAHGAFLHGAILGALVGAGALDGPWVGTVRTAHLHVNLLGWAGLTLLATVVFFGPTIARTRIVEGADAQAATGLRYGATALTVAVLAIVATGFDGAIGAAFRGVAAAGLAGFAWVVTAVCVPVARAMAVSRAPTRWAVTAVASWFVAVAWLDAAAVLSGDVRWLEPLGAAMLLGVLAQAIASAVGYLLPRLRRLDPLTGYGLSEAWATARAAAWNAGVVLVVASAVANATGDATEPSIWSAAGRVGWGLILAAAAVNVAVGLRPGRT